MRFLLTRGIRLVLGGRVLIVETGLIVARRMAAIFAVLKGLQANGYLDNYSSSSNKPGRSGYW